jgi:hypothetical protein
LNVCALASGPHAQIANTNNVASDRRRESERIVVSRVSTVIRPPISRMPDQFQEEE